MTRRSQPSVPRTRGDEPDGTPAFQAGVSPFPARAGMNRTPTLPALRGGDRVPRTRGDEPQHSALKGVAIYARSPHARG